MREALGGLCAGVGCVGALRGVVAAVRMRSMAYDRGAVRLWWVWLGRVRGVLEVVAGGGRRILRRVGWDRAGACGLIASKVARTGLLGVLAQTGEGVVEISAFDAGACSDGRGCSSDWCCAAEVAGTTGLVAVGVCQGPARSVSRF